MLALPGRVIRILDGQLGKLRLGARYVRCVCRPQLALHDSHGPAIHGDVVDREQQHVLVCGQPYERRAEDRAGAQVERRAAFLDDEARGFSVACLRLDLAQVRDEQRNRSGWQDDLHWLPFRRVEHGAECFVPLDEI